VSNVFSQNPIIIDTVWTTGTIPAALTALTSPEAFSLIKFVNPAAAGNECKITDGAGNVLFDEFASAIGLDVTLWDASVGGKKYVFKQGLWVVATLGGVTATTSRLFLWK
jgi:hypothetical protein